MKRIFKYLLIAPPVLLCAAALYLSHWTPAQTHPDIPASTEEERLSWLAVQGIDAEPIASQAAVIPSDFGGIYAEYAALQETQGLPLAEYAGESAVCTTYLVKGHEPLLYAELLTADGILIGAQCYAPEESRCLPCSIS